MDNKPVSRKSPARKPPLRVTRRASDRRAANPVISINLAEKSLKALMVEQCKDGFRYLTVYRGSHAELVAAGVPETAFPKEGTIAKFAVQTLNACSTGSCELLRGSMQSTDTGLELEVDWGPVSPYLQGSHPAVHALAWILLKDVEAWIDSADIPNLAHPLEMLAADSRSEYRPSLGAPRLEISAEFHKKLSDYAHDLYHFVFEHCELIQSADAAAKQPTRPSLRLAIDNTKELADALQ